MNKIFPNAAGVALLLSNNAKIFAGLFTTLCAFFIPQR